MNGRIKELMDQTGVPVSMPFDQWCEKFAELIVKECSKVIRNGGQIKGAFGYEDLRPSEIAEMIETHFGIEE